MDRVEPLHLVRSALSRGVLASFPNSQLSIVSAGKAAWPMAAALHTPDARAAMGTGVTLGPGLVAGPRTRDLALPPSLEYFDASHPSPDAVSEAAGRRALALAEASRSRGALVVLLSGGASSMLAVPAAGVSLADKMAIARALMLAGVPIEELNCVRKHLSAVKGGRLAAASLRTLTLAISDVHGPIADDPAVIGSGPTVPDPTTCGDALSIVRQAGVWAMLPRSVLTHLERGGDESPKPGDSRLGDSAYEVIGNRHLAMEGAAHEAHRLGYAVRIIEAATSGEARAAGVAFADTALSSPGGAAFCVIASGETTVRVRGHGRGGRNQEFALGAVPAIDARHPHGGGGVVLASAGTDGIDGPTDAAGAIVDSTTTVRAAERGLRAEAALISNGAYDFFAPLGDLIMWGPTGTNVGDLHVMLVHP